MRQLLRRLLVIVIGGVSVSGLAGADTAGPVTTSSVLAGPVVDGLALEVSDAYVRGMPPGQKNTAAFMRLHNPAAEELVLVGAESPVAEKLEFHRHVHNAGMMRMVQQSQIVIPAKGEVVFQPGGYHLMLIGLKGFLRQGDRVALSLKTSRGQIVTMDAPVISVLHRHH